jgi:gluconolactonase
MKSKGILLTAILLLATIAVVAQAPAPQQGPGVQALQDARYAEFVRTKCKVPPPQRGGGGRGPAAANAAAAGPPMPREYTVMAIPGVIAAGQKWKSVWTGTGNNADGIIATKDGGILAAQNTNSQVMKIDKDGKVSFPYKDTNTGGAVSMNKKGALFVVERGLGMAIEELEPKRHIVANMMNGEPFECGGGLLNDLTAAANGGVYFTAGNLYYMNPAGVVARQGTVTGTNGVILSPDEKKLYVTGRLESEPAPAQGGRGGAPNMGPGMIAYDVKPDGSLGNEHRFSTAGGDGSTIDAQGRIYTTTNGDAGIAVLGPDGKVIGTIPTPLNFITVAFSGPDKKTLYGVANNQRFDEIFTIQMIAQGYKGRAK